MTDDFGMRVDCPHCAEPIALTAALMKDQVLTLRLTWEGEWMQARTVAGAIDNTRKLLEATAKEMGGAAIVFVRSIAQQGKEINVEFLVTTKSKRARPTPEAGLGARINARFKAIHEEHGDG